MTDQATLHALGIRSRVALAPRTTLELGGEAESFAEARDEAHLAALLEHARGAGMPVAILGGGSNVVVPDEGVAGLVIVPAMRGIAVDGELVTVAAGESWDPFVAWTVAQGLAGLECLSGIPGSVGATPIQNVGAYGVEVGERLVSIDVFDRRTRRIETLTVDDLALGYRDSALKRDPTRAVVTSVRFRLDPGGAPTVRYAELVSAVAPDAGLAEVRDTVIALRRRKSMVVDPADPNRRSAGSFFTNPIVSRDDAERVVRLALEAGIVGDASAVPRWDAEGGRVKLAAGWLIERAGITKGLRRGNVGVSTAHALALVHHGGGSVRELDALRDEVLAAVRNRFGVVLEREPVSLSGSRDP